MLDRGIADFRVAPYAIGLPHILSCDPDGCEDPICAVATCAGASDAWLVPMDGDEGAFSQPDNPLRALDGKVRRAMHANSQPMPPFWLEGVKYLLCLPLPIEDRVAACLVLSYPAEMTCSTQADVQQRAAMLAPLVRSHFQAQTAAASHRRQIDSAMAALNATQVGVILFDSQGGMILANDAARAILDEKDGMRMGNQAPMPVSIKDAARFQIALEHQIAENALPHGRQRCSTVMLVQRGGGRRPLVATLVAARRPVSTKGEPAVILYLLDPQIAQLDYMEAVCELYGLTKVEARLTHHIAAGKTMEEAADTMRIRASTARTYLKHIFMKTGTHRQVDLVRLLLLSTGRIASLGTPVALR